MQGSRSEHTNLFLYYINAKLVVHVHDDALFVLGRDRASDIIRLDRIFPVPAVDEHDELDRPRSTEADEGVEGSPGRAPGKKHIINEDNGPICNIDGKLSRLTDQRRTLLIITIGTHIEGVDVEGLLFDETDMLRERFGHHGPAPANAEDLQVSRSPISFDDLVRQTAQRPLHALRAT